MFKAAIMLMGSRHKTYGEWRYGSLLSLHYMELSGRLHAPATLILIIRLEPA